MRQITLMGAWLLYAAAAFAQENIEELATNRALLDQLERNRGRTIDVDPSTELGRYVRAFNLAPSNATTVPVTQDMIDRARATYEYFSQPRYYPGKQILARDTATGWITHRAVIEEVLPGDQYKIKVTEVLEFNPDKSPKRTRVVERIVPHSEVAALNDGTLLRPGNSYFGIRYEPEQDPLLKEAIEKANRIVDEHFPDFRRPPAEVARQQRKLFLELMKVAKALDYPPSGRDPEYSRRMTELSNDPFYSARRNWAGAYLKGGYGVCVDQASVATQIINSVARRAGIDMQLVSGQTLAENAGHGFTVVNFRGDPNRYISDPTWETNRSWWRHRPPESYRGQLLLDMEYAMGAAGYNRNRRIVSVEGEQIRTPPPSTRIAARARAEAVGLGHFAAAYVLKETIKGHPIEGLRQLKEPGFWGSAALFSGVAKAADWTLKGAPRLARATLPLAAGMAAVQLLTGQASLKNVLIGTASYLAAGALVNLAADTLIYPLLFAAGPPGWIAAGLYTVGKLAVTLYLGEKIEGWLHGLFAPKKSRAAAREGFVHKIESMGGTR